MNKRKGANMAQKYGRPLTGQKENNYSTMVVSRENYDKVVSLAIRSGMTRSAIVNHLITKGLKRARIEEVAIKTKQIVFDD